ncbi:glutamate synthase (NADH) large subunit [Nakamurella panacisegetis]|uniref:Glutamate synthase (NADH) large subunit n=1 Tax=Nakamurella panacisegetis TaxID=1090615 RepID=A0A1H0RNQ1_9ACTN|nr:glutamate synthase large subunit [Nakamurella panacisegetis]SDP31161.1 glutamate synthase (NADH) large subunit [Nakamurella panacisegetis]
MKYSAIPGPQGLYDPAFERDSCGVAAVADIKGRRSNKIVADGITALINLEHRGAAGADPAVGDGAGILFQVPEGFLRAVVDFDLPVVTGANSPDGCAFAVGTAFLPQDDSERARAKELISRIADEENLEVIGWREVPTDPIGSGVGKMALDVMPVFEQLFLAGPKDQAGHRPFGVKLDRLVYPLRKRVERETAEQGIDVYFPSLSSRTLVYKGMLTTQQLPDFYDDIRDRRVESAIAVVHSRFSTNTFPAWPLAHPFRFIAHNGEINTVRGNRNRMRARESLLASDLIPGDLNRIFPINSAEASDSASFDEVLELLHLGGRSLPHAVLMMIPEAWENGRETMDPAVRGFAEFHASLMEPWDGPACVTFTDGRLLGAVLDRNGLRPGRWWLTSDDTVVLASEAGVLSIPPEKIVERGRLQPGRMFLVDTVAGRILDDTEVKAELAAEHPYSEWVHAGLVPLDELPAREHVITSHDAVLRRQQVFGYSEEDLRMLLTPMARTGAEAIGSMGTDTPEAVLSARPRLLFDYFSQLFAQVTNPPLDAIREQIVTSMSSVIGPEANLLDPSPSSCRQISLPFPVIDNDDLAKLIGVNSDGDMPGFAAAVISGLYEVDGGGAALGAALERCRREADAAIEAGARILVLSDRDCDAKRAPIPSLLLTSAVHQHLVRQKSRTKVALITETGDAREVHHVALLLGYGAGAVNPYLALESAEDLAVAGLLGDVRPAAAVKNTIYALGKGVLKVMSKMGISTVGSYRQAQVFAAFGIDESVLGEYFTGTTSRTGGSDLDVIAADILERHSLAFVSNTAVREHRGLEIGGQYQWRREGEIHLFNPETVYLLQHATKTKQVSVFRRYTDTVDELSRKGGTLRGLFGLRTDVRTPIPLTEVEPVEDIVKRFVTGAMSYGSISIEAHETLAIAMNRLGGRSNTGEGGEDIERLLDPRRRSAIKQVASGRFGVTSAYLVNSDEIQIKMAQGAKPGEGGQLPGNKVYPWIGKTRHATTGVGLISPPPHHDIYSIEDLKQLIHDLRNANPRANVSVKLVAEPGVGTVAAGVVKAHADLVIIAGYDGGTGAAPLTSLKHTGQPWELGLAEAQQTLRLNGLREQVRLQADGGLKTGRDVVIAALLGAEEFGFATAPLVVAGCVMMRVCHLDTCPVGIATQNPVLRERFTGTPEFVETFFLFLAEQVREYLAALGFRSIDEAVGHAELLDIAPAVDHHRARGLDLAPLLAVADVDAGHRCTNPAKHDLSQTLDARFIESCAQTLHDGSPVELEFDVRNVDRTVGTMLGSEVTRRFGPEALPQDTIRIALTGTAGQSLGAFLPRGITLTLTGDANDYVAKGLSGGRIVVRPAENSPAQAPGAKTQVIAGNTIGYGATSGELYLRGRVGERFAVRNSGALMVTEGTGDHALEYMTGGRVVILGRTGRNAAAGMSGGIAYLLDADHARINKELVDVEPLELDEFVWLGEVIADHVRYTGSPIGRRLLDSWETESARFSRVMPRDYKRVLELQAKAEETGVDADELIMEATRG